MLHIHYKFTILFLSASALCSGCMTNRSTTTERTAVEQALLSQSAEAAIDQLDLSRFSGTYTIDTKDFDAVDDKYVLGYLNKKLVDAGATPHINATPPDVRIFPSVANGAIDDSSILIGIPEFPVSLPGVGAITVPEAAIFKIEKQIGRYRLFLRGQRFDGDPQSLCSEIVTSQKFYNRWTLLFLFSFRTTDLSKPF